MYTGANYHLNVGYVLRVCWMYRDESLWDTIPFIQQGQTLTNDPKDAQDVGGEDNQQVDASKQASGDEHMPQPAELLVLKQHLLDGTSYLGRWKAPSVRWLPVDPPFRWPRNLSAGSPGTERLEP